MQRPNSISSWFSQLSGWFMIAILVLVNGCTKENLDLYPVKQKSVEIRELILQCNYNQLPALANFWSNKMGFQPTVSSNNSFTVKVGSSLLTFRGSQYSSSYHFSLDIPENQIENACKWLKNRAKLIPDVNSGAEFIHKSRLNAHSVFFTDPAHNLIELIARHDLKNSMPGEFDSTMVLNISNVAIVTRSIKDCLDILYSDFMLQAIEGTSNSVKLIGGETGTLTLHVPTKPFAPTDDFIAFPYKLEIVVSQADSKTIKLPGSETTVIAEP